MKTFATQTLVNCLRMVINKEPGSNRNKTKGTCQIPTEDAKEIIFMEHCIGITSKMRQEVFNNLLLPHAGTESCLKNYQRICNVDVGTNKEIL